MTDRELGKCTCIYATSKNCSAVRKGYVMGGSVREKCDNCKARLNIFLEEQKAKLVSDVEFLEWVRDRLVHVYGESPNVDFVRRLGNIISDAKVGGRK